MKTKLNKIKDRQQARFLRHLEKTGQSTARLEQDVKRAYGYWHQDIEAMIDNVEAGVDRVGGLAFKDNDNNKDETNERL